MGNLRDKLHKLLRWSEKYFKTDMVYLAGVGLWANLNVIISSILGLLLSVAFANLLPKEVYGTYQYLLSLSAIITSLCLGGMQQAVTQSVARGNEGDVALSVKAQLRWNLVPMAIGLLLASYYLINHNTTLALGFVIIAILSPLIITYSIYSSLLSGTKRFRDLFVYSSISNGVYYLGIFLSVILLKNALWLMAINLGINAVVNAVLYARILKKYKSNDNTDPHTISYGRHLSVMNAFGTVITQIDSVLVFHFLGAANLALYSFATLIPERIAGLTGFIGTAALPKFSTRSLDEIRSVLIDKILRAAAFGTVIAILYSLLSPLLFHALFPKYLNAIPYTQWYSPIIILFAVNFVSSVLVSQRLKTELYLTSFINPILLIALQIPLLLLYGIWGIIAARLITDLIGIIFSIWLILRKNSFNNGLEVQNGEPQS